MAVALAAVSMAAGCQKYDDTVLKKELQDLREKLSSLQTWCTSSQAAIDAVSVLQNAVRDMNGVESVEAFEDEDGSGYIITFTNKESIRLYNGQSGKDGDAFFGDVLVGESCVEFVLADGTRFVVDRVTTTIAFESFDTKTVSRKDTIWTVMDPSITKADFAAFTADFKTNGGTVTAIATKADANGNPWCLEAIAPEFGEDGKLVKPAGVVVKDAPQAGGKGVLKVALVTNDGKEATSSLVVDVAPNYLAFQAVEDGALVSIRKYGSLEAPSLEYSNDLVEWTEFDFRTQPTIELAKAGDKVYFRNVSSSDRFSKDEYNYIRFVFGNRKIAAEGNVMSLIDNTCESDTIPCDFCFYLLFYGASSLTAAPELPAMQLASNCYCGMFVGCTSLEVAPDLPAVTLAPGCYSAMFQACYYLRKAPALNAKKLARLCYSTMLEDCSSLEEAPALPATEMEEGCYNQMFAWCYSLKTAPALPADKLAVGCYYCMFYDCTALEAASELPATELAGQCYAGMYSYCKGLETAPELPAPELVDGCYDKMFFNCWKISYLKVGFEDWCSGACTRAWVGGVSAQGVFECPENLEVKYSSDYVPNGWSVSKNGEIIDADQSDMIPTPNDGPGIEPMPQMTIKIAKQDGEGVISL